MYFWTILISLSIYFPSVIRCTFSGCLSEEQFLASLDRTKTLVFEAHVLQTGQSGHDLEAYVSIRKVVRQSPVGWQLTEGSMAYIKGIRPRVVDSALCIPRLVVGQRYLWTTFNEADSNQGSLKFYPGGLFLITAKHGNLQSDNDNQEENSIQDQFQQDAGYPKEFDSQVRQNQDYRYPGQFAQVCDRLPCPLEITPVCGTDGLLYQNECVLKHRECSRRYNRGHDMSPDPIRIDPTRQCIRQSNIDALLCDSNNLCTFGAVCSIELQANQLLTHLSQSTCDCDHINCVGDWPDPICATDGVSYANECYLRKAACKQQQSKQIFHRGHCAANPCSGHTCRWPGERCEVDGSGRPKCVCSGPCPSVVLPVCGSDGMTYDSHCHLELAACTKMKNVWVLYAGQCSDETKCHALGLHCQDYEVCSRIREPLVYPIQSRQYQSQNPNNQPLVAQCVCPTCPEQGIGGQVCGTDGQSYRSECHLRASVCQRHLHGIKVRTRGPCDVCSDVRCDFYAICQRNINGEPQCVCPTACPYTGNDQSVCGSDGNMYENECHLKVRSCAEQHKIYVVHLGPCKQCPQGCPFGYQCRNGMCICRDSCPSFSAGLDLAVCGTDGVIYSSECELKRTACIKSTTIDVDLTGNSCQQEEDVGADTVDRQPQADEVQSSRCRCHNLGARSEFCNSKSRCDCKPGAEGEQCERCSVGYWGLEIGRECIACSCHPHGSLDSSCDQSNGQCKCGDGVLGRQCSICPNGEQPSALGCEREKKSIDNTEESKKKSNNVNPAEKSANRTEHQPPVNLINGRQFLPATTLLVHAPTQLEQPLVVELEAVLSDRDGYLVQYRVAPTKQEQLLLENVRDHHFTLAIERGHVICSYLDGRKPDRVLLVRYPQPIESNQLHRILAGVQLSQPWIKIDNLLSTTSRDVRVQTLELDNINDLHAGGYRTIVIGRPIFGTTVGASPSISFTGCLLKFSIHADQPLREFKIDLISGDRSELAWLGVKRLPSGLTEAPLCTASDVQFTKPRDLDRHLQYDEHLAERPLDPALCGLGPNQLRCENEGECIQGVCMCQPGWQGKVCGNVVTIIPQFDGTGFIRLPGPRGPQSMQQKRLQLKIQFLAVKAPGLLFYVPPRSSDLRSGSFIAVYLDEQNYLIVACRFGLQRHGYGNQHLYGSRIASLRYKIPISLNKWHSLKIDKKPHRMMIQVDTNEKQRIRFLPRQYNQVNKDIRRQLLAFDLSDSPIYLGGYYFASGPTLPGNIQTGFIGAVQKININGAEVVLAGSPISHLSAEQRLAHPQTEYWMNVTQWQGSPCGPKTSPCDPRSELFICRPDGEQSKCACSTPFQLWQLMRTLQSNDPQQAEVHACQERRLQLSHLGVNNQPGQHSNNFQQDASAGQAKAAEEHSNVNTEKEGPLIVNNPVCKGLAVQFSGSTIFRRNNLLESTKNFNLRFRLATTSQNGLILLLTDVPHKPTTEQIEITVVALRKGKVEFGIFKILSDTNQIETMRGRLVVNVLQIYSSQPIADGHCHTIHMVRSRQRATLIIDNRMVSGESLIPQNLYPIGNQLVLGGSTIQINGLPWEYHQNLTGCLSDLYVNEQTTPILHPGFRSSGPVLACER